MKYTAGCWYYQGKAYATLHEALLEAWPR